MAIFLNFPLLLSSFLCFDQPIVINTKAIILIKGCSKEVNRIAESFISPSIADPLGETKYKIKPISNCMCERINANKEIRKSLSVNNFLETIPIIALTAAKNKTVKTM